MKKHSSLFTLSIAIVAIVVVVLVGGQFVAHAEAASASMNGWTWSSNIGWGSASSTQPGAGVSEPYGLTVNNSGNINGYIWTSNIGWIKFGSLSGFPANGTPHQDAKVYSTGVVEGWARACSGTIKSGDSQTVPLYPGDCSTMT